MCIPDDHLARQRPNYEMLAATLATLLGLADASRLVCPALSALPAVRGLRGDAAVARRAAIAPRMSASALPDPSEVRLALIGDRIQPCPDECAP